MAILTKSERGRFDWPWRGGPTFVTPDGSKVSLGGGSAQLPTLDLSRPWSASFIAAVRGVRRAFSVAESGAFDWHSAYSTVPDEIRRQDYRGGELVLGIRYPRGGAQPRGSSEQHPGEYRAAWRGQWFELHTRDSGLPPAEGVTPIFDAFRLTDTPLGMVVIPRSVRQVRMEPVQLHKDIPGLGDLIIERPATSPVMLPDQHGYPTPHGELWRQPLGREGRGRTRTEALVLATPTAVAQLLAGTDDTPDPNQAADFLANLDVHWELL